jgi:hypothetical protein
MTTIFQVESFVKNAEEGTYKVHLKEIDQRAQPGRRELINPRSMGG